MSKSETQTVQFIGQLVSYNIGTKNKGEKELNTMYEFRITKLATGEESIIFGYDTISAFHRAKLNPAEWVVWNREYID